MWNEINMDLERWSRWFAHEAQKLLRKCLTQKIKTIRCIIDISVITQYIDILWNKSESQHNIAQRNGFEEWGRGGKEECHLSKYTQHSI